MNIAYNKKYISDTSDSVSGGVGIGFPIAHNLALVADLEDEEGINKNLDGTRDQNVRANVGFMKPISKRFSIYGSIGETLSSSDGQRHKYFNFGLSDSF